MRKLYFLLFTVLSFVSFINISHAQTVTIGTGTSTQRFPLGYFYGYERSAAIYTATEMGTTGASASILTVGYNTTIANSTGPTIIYLKEVGTTTTQTASSWANKISGATMVYSGTPAIGAVGWRTITLTTPFPLNQGVNLEVLVETNTGGGGVAGGTAAGNAIQYSTVTTGHQSWNQDNTVPTGNGTVTNLRPNIQLLLGPPIVCVAPPGGGTLTGPAPVCPGNNFTLTVSGGTFGSGLTYQWQSSPDGVGWTDITGATAASLTTSQVAATYYRRRTTCSAQNGFSNSVQVMVTPPISTFPWSENFNSITPPALPTCTSVQNVNGGTTWNTVANVNLNTWGFSSPNALVYGYSATLPGNDWFFTPGFSLVAGTTYRLRFKYGPTDPLYPENLRVSYGSLPTATSMTNAIVNYPGIVANSAAPFAKSANVNFTPATSGVYYIGFQSYSTPDQFNLYLDDIIFDPLPACLPPSNLVATAVSPTSETISWTAASPTPTTGYQWEVRTSGVGGSGATGLAASGVTASGVLTQTVTGLIQNTNYTLWVRSDCSAANYSEWTGPLAFHTLCNVITALPFTETFETTSTSRDCWTNQYVSGSLDWTLGAGAGGGGAVTTAHGGTVNARIFGTGSGAVTKYVSPTLDLSPLTTSGADLEFWYANQDFFGDINELRVFYKTSIAGAWTLFPGAVYTTNVGVWTKVTLENIPGLSNQYSIAFEGTEIYGYGIAVDDVVIKAAPTCRPVKNAYAIGTTPTSANVYFTSPATNFIVEYGTPGFTPGTGATAGTGGTIVTGAASPITISGLAVSTTYDVYVRTVCVAGSDYSENTKLSVTTLCSAVPVPYTQNFETSVAPGMPTCTTIQDLNGNSGPVPNTGGGGWITGSSTTATTFVSPTNSLRYIYDAGVPTRGADDWFYLRGLNLTAGQSYRLKFFFKASDGPLYVEQLEVKYGTQAQSGAMTNLIYSNTNIASALANPFDSAQADFTPSATGVYYLGFHAMSAPDQAFLYIDDISVKATPIVDMGVTGIVLPDVTCASTASVFVQATIRNYNLTPIDFAARPITVNAVITGSASTTLTTVINTGTLAAGASMNVYLNPAFVFSAGSYRIVTSTVSPDDSEPGNNSFTRDVIVNPIPPAAIITPSPAQVCVGGTVQLNTQFVPITGTTVLPTVSSGTIAVAIPDNSPAGVSNSLAISGIPANAAIVSMNVTFSATHTYNSDLIVNLRAPNGNILNLVNRRGGSGANFTNAIISSTSTNPLPATNTTITGTFAADGASAVGPTASLSNVAAFAGLFTASNGTWSLAIRDAGAGDAGTLTSWSISITYQLVNPKITWTPITGLFTNAAATVPYVAGADAYSVFVKPTATTTYTATATSIAGCRATTNVTVNVNPFPVVTIGSIPDTVCGSDATVPLTATPAGGIWTGPGVSGSNFIPPATGFGTFTLTYTSTSAAGCTTTATKKISVKDCPERIVRLRDNALLLFPNPNDGKFNVRINSVLYNTLGMRVYTNSGLLVHTQQFSGLVYGRVLPIDLTNLPGGLYIVKFYYDGGTRYSDKTFNVIIGH